MVILAGFTKSAQFPFRFWLPEAMAAPTPVSSLVHSSTLVVAGVFIVLAFQGNLPLKSIFLIRIISGWTLLLARICACLISDVKKLVALSTLRQIALLFYSLPLGVFSVVAIHLITHALFKSGLFIRLGVILHSNTGLQDTRLTKVRRFNGSYQLIILSILGLRGVICSSGFVSKELILNESLVLGSSWLVFFVLGAAVVGTLSYTWRLLIFTKCLEYPTHLRLNSDRNTYFYVLAGIMLSLSGAGYFISSI